MTTADESLIEQRLGRRTHAHRFQAPPGTGLFAARASRPPAFIPPDAAEAVRLLVSNIRDRYVRPAMQTRSRDEFFAFLGEQWDDYIEAVNALRTILSMARPCTPLGGWEEDGSAVVDIAREVAGEDASQEAAFALRTFERALQHLRELAAPVLDGMEEQDAELAWRFSSAAALHVLGHLCLFQAAQGESVSAPAVHGAFEVLRMGALDAYSAVREAVELRRPSVPTEGDVLLSLDELQFIDSDASHLD